MVNENQGRFRQQWLIFTVFPGAWLIGTTMASLGHLPWPILISVFLGLITYIAARCIFTVKFFGYGRGRLFSFAAFLGIIIVSAGLTVVYGLHEYSKDERSPIGEASEYDPTFDICRRVDHNIANGAGSVASVRRVECSVFLFGWTRDYFVFVHGRDEPNTRRNLVFRYGLTQDDRDWAIAPKVTWANDSTLVISTGRLYTVTLLMTRIDNVSVKYLLEHGGINVGEGKSLANCRPYVFCKE